MALTKVSPSLFQVSNNITSVTVGGSANTISLTFDSNGVITGATNNAVSVANTAITGNIISSQIASVNGSVITANTIANSAIQTGAVENYMGAQGTSFGIRNKIINGAMVIDQRKAGGSLTPTTATYSLDRWQATCAQASKYSVQQNAGSVTPPVGFTSYLGVTSLSSYSITTTDTFTIRQIIEGYNLQDLAWGTASAKSVSISFWVYSSLTGTFGGSLANNSASRSYPFVYTISSANTWEYKTVIIPGDTGGSIPNTNAQGLYLIFGLGVGSSAATTAGAWNPSFYYGATGATSVVGTNAATWYITGVQMEKGSSVTPFEYRPYGKELMLCQRYFSKTYQIETAVGTSTTVGCYGVIASGSTALIGGGNKWPVQMRATPTVTIYSQIGTSAKLSASGAVDTGSGVAIETPSQFGAVGIFASGGFTGATWYYGHFAADAEL